MLVVAMDLEVRQALLILDSVGVADLAAHPVAMAVLAALVLSL
jgi:hypothetical protein